MKNYFTWRALKDCLPCSLQVLKTNEERERESWSAAGLVNHQGFYAYKIFFLSLSSHATKQFENRKVVVLQVPVSSLCGYKRFTLNTVKISFSGDRLWIDIFERTFHICLQSAFCVSLLRRNIPGWHCRLILHTDISQWTFCIFLFCLFLLHWHFVNIHLESTRKITTDQMLVLAMILYLTTGRVIQHWDLVLGILHVDMLNGIVIATTGALSMETVVGIKRNQKVYKKKKNNSVYFHTQAILFLTDIWRNFPSQRYRKHNLNEEK